MSGTAFGASSTTFTPACFHLSSGRERDKQGYGDDPGQEKLNTSLFRRRRHKRLPTSSAAADRRRAWSVAQTAMYEASRGGENGGIEQ